MYRLIEWCNVNFCAGLSDTAVVPVYLRYSWQLDQEGKGVVFMTTLIALSGFNPHRGYVVASLDKTLYDIISLLGGIEQVANELLT